MVRIRVNEQRCLQHRSAGRLRWRGQLHALVEDCLDARQRGVVQALLPEDVDVDNLLAVVDRDLVLVAGDLYRDLARSSSTWPSALSDHELP